MRLADPPLGVRQDCPNRNMQAHGQHGRRAAMPGRATARRGRRAAGAPLLKPQPTVAALTGNRPQRPSADPDPATSTQRRDCIGAVSIGSVVVGRLDAQSRALGAGEREGCHSAGADRCGDRVCVMRHRRAASGRSACRRQRSRPPGERPDDRVRGKGIARPEQPREPKQSWRAQSPHAWMSALRQRARFPGRPIPSKHNHVLHGHGPCRGTAATSITRSSLGQA